MKKIREKIEQELGKIQGVIDSSSLSDLRRSVQTSIDDARSVINEHLNEIDKANEAADQFIDLQLGEVVQSKWTPVILAAGTMLAIVVGFVLGVVVGMYL